mmetsp:Transcript_36823/g.59589  ORF Transcript_36823/g.59589 Transcript_36823/m.59589 type:complete len:444 (-) Transcript_36823:4289-5620(-)
MDSISCSAYEPSLLSLRNTLFNLSHVITKSSHSGKSYPSIDLCRCKRSDSFGFGKGNALIQCQKDGPQSTLASLPPQSNNTSFVVMNAGAKEISAGGVGLVYFFNIFPSLMVKATAPFWFHTISYRMRVIVAAIAMSVSMLVVAFFRATAIQLIGVGIGSFGSALGEATFLAYTANFKGRLALTAWSSGTGFAGVFGFGWVLFFTKLLKSTFRVCLLFGNVIPLGLYLSYVYILGPHVSQETAGRETQTSQVHEWAFWQRVRQVASLWPFTVPLMLVYASEYAMQSGTWAVIGFPINDKAARDNFYMISNTFYQIGVFLSRSSGMFLDVGKAGLWVMPAIQVCLLLFFIVNGIYQWWWNYGLLALALLAGLMGGMVYVHGFILISKHTPSEKREFALGSASVADTFGIMIANISGLVIQGCLYGVNHLSDHGKPPVFKCGFYP